MGYCDGGWTVGLVFKKKVCGMRRTVRHMIFAAVALALGVIYAGAFAGSITDRLFG
jgi:hypothetical protein